VITIDQIVRNKKRMTIPAKKAKIAGK